jgi:hypothetical protein
MHARRVSPAVEILSGHPDHAPTPITASTPPAAHAGNRPSDDGLVATTPGTAMWAPYTIPITPAPTMSIFMTNSHELIRDRRCAGSCVLQARW